MKKLIILIICLLLSTFVFSGCVNRTEESDADRRTEPCRPEAAG